MLPARGMAKWGMNQSVRIATRRSPLALWQANHVAERLRSAHPGIAVELLPMVTEGDRILDRALAEVGGKGLFIKELEVAMLEGRADLAVHSMKDVPAELPPGMILATVLERADPRDALVSSRHASLEALPQGARVGTSSLRRQCQLRHLRPDLQVGQLRGNVQTRLAKLDSGDFDAILLATAGLDRLGMASRIRHRVAPEQLLPAVGQGIVGIECRESDHRLRALLAPLEHAEARLCLTAERSMAGALQGSCQSPIAGFAELQGDELKLRGLVGMPDGSRVLADAVTGPAADAPALGLELAKRLLAAGAGELLGQAPTGARPWQ